MILNDSERKNIRVSFGNSQLPPHLKVFSDFMYYLHRIYTSLEKLEIIGDFARRHVPLSGVLVCRVPLYREEYYLVPRYIEQLDDSLDKRGSSAYRILTDDDLYFAEVSADGTTVIEPGFSMDIVTMTASSLPESVLSASKGPIDTVVKHLLYGDEIKEGMQLDNEERRYRIAGMKLQMARDYLGLVDRYGEERAQEILHRIDSSMARDMKRLTTIGRSYRLQITDEQ